MRCDCIISWFDEVILMFGCQIVLCNSGDYSESGAIICFFDYYGLYMLYRMLNGLADGLFGRNFPFCWNHRNQPAAFFA